MELYDYVFDNQITGICDELMICVLQLATDESNGRNDGCCGIVGEPG